MNRQKNNRILEVVLPKAGDPVKGGVLRLSPADGTTRWILSA